MIKKVKFFTKTKQDVGKKTKNGQFAQKMKDKKIL